MVTLKGPQSQLRPFLFIVIPPPLKTPKNAGNSSIVTTMSPTLDLGPNQAFLTDQNALR